MMVAATLWRWALRPVLAWVLASLVAACLGALELALAGFAQSGVWGSGAFLNSFFRPIAVLWLLGFFVGAPMAAGAVSLMRALRMPRPWADLCIGALAGGFAVALGFGVFDENSWLRALYTAPLAPLMGGALGLGLAWAAFGRRWAGAGFWVGFLGALAGVISLYAWQFGLPDLPWSLFLGLGTFVIPGMPLLAGGLAGLSYWLLAGRPRPPYGR